MTRIIVRNNSIGFLIAGVIIVSILPLIIPSQWIQLLTQVLIMALFATGLNMEMGYAGMMPLGQATFLGLGAYSFGILIVKAHLSLAPAIVLALFICLIVNAIIGFLCLRGKPMTFGLLHMAFNILFTTIVAKWIPVTGGDVGLSGIPRPHIFAGTVPFYYMVLGSVLICYLIISTIMNSPFGKIAQGLRENEERLIFLGINTKRYQLVLFIISGFFAGVAGILLAMLNRGVFSSYVQIILSAQAMMMCLIGGAYSFWGPTLGAALVVIFSNTVSNYVFYWQGILGVIMIVTVLGFRGGILRKRRVKTNVPAVSVTKITLGRDSRVILKTVGLSKDFGSLRAVNDVSLEIQEGTIRAVIGPNGAGKTTLFDLITNRTRPTSGKVYFQEKDISYLPPYKIVKLGIGKCFQISKLFPGLSVFENIQIACISRAKKVFNMYSPGNKAMRDEVLQIIKSIGLTDLADASAGYLSYGDQRRLEIGITLALQPTLLLLDEPTAGVSRAEGYEVMKLIKKLASERALTIVFIEHDMDIVFNYAEEITVMHQGTIIATGVPEAIKSNKQVQSCYLGETVC